MRTEIYLGKTLKCMVNLEFRVIEVKEIVIKSSEGINAIK